MDCPESNSKEHDSRRSWEQIQAWEDFIEQQVYPDAHKSQADYRNYEGGERDSVREFYQQNHRFQTVEFVQSQREKYLPPRKQRMSPLEALDFLNTLIDDSDPDLELDQRQHLLQTSEAIRKDNHPDWFVLTGFLHDFGKVLCLFGEPQWSVVGDTFPVGCAFSDRIVYSEFFADNADTTNPQFQSQLGIYERGCGLRNVLMSWGHDEYLYHVLKDHLPEPALYMIRYHSFYAWHREEEYDYLCDDHDREMLNWVRAFNPYDLYSKSPVPPDWNQLKPYYTSLIDKYLPAELVF